MAESYYDKWMADRSKKQQDIRAKINRGVPVENMGIGGMNRALDGLYAQISDYKQSDAYKEKVAMSQAKREEKKTLRKGGQPVLDSQGNPMVEAKMVDGKLVEVPRVTDPMSRKEARQQYKKDAASFAEEKDIKGNRYKKRKEYNRQLIAAKDAKSAVGDDDNKKVDEKSPASMLGSPLHFGKADPTLVAGVRTMGQAGRSYDPWSGPTELINRIALMKKGVREATDKELENYSLDEVQDGFNSFENGNNACTSYLTEAKRELASLKAEARKVGHDDPRFDEIKSKMTKVEDRWKKLNTKMTSVQLEKDNWANMHGKGDGDGNNDGRFKYSDATLLEGNNDYDYLNQVMANNASMLINNNGDIEFEVASMDGDGTTEIVTIDQLKKGVWERDESGQTAWAKFRNDVVEKGQKQNLSFNQGKAESMVNQLFGNNQSPQKRNMVSWMYDDLDGDGKTWIDDFKAEFPDVDASAFKPNADWDAPYMVDEDGVEVESGQTIGDYLRDELKAYYIERMRGVHNTLVKANGKSKISPFGGIEPQLP